MQNKNKYIYIYIYIYIRVKICMIVIVKEDIGLTELENHQVMNFKFSQGDY